MPSDRKIMMPSDLINNFTSTEDVISMIYKNVSQTTETPLEYHSCDERNVNFNCSPEEYLRFYRGPQTLPLIIVLPVSNLMYSECIYCPLRLNILVLNFMCRKKK